MEPMEWVVVGVILIVVFLFFKNSMTTHTAASIQSRTALATVKSGTCAGDCFKGGTTIAAGVPEPSVPAVGAAPNNLGINPIKLSSIPFFANSTPQIQQIYAEHPDWGLTQNGWMSQAELMQLKSEHPDWFGLPVTNVSGVPLHVAFPISPSPTPIAIQSGAPCRLQYRQQQPTSTVPKALRL